MSLGYFLAKFTEWDRIQMLLALFDLLASNLDSKLQLFFDNVPYII